MSIWRNVGLEDPPIVGLDYEDQRTTIGVAKGWDDEVRVAIRGGSEGEIVLSHMQVRRLVERLNEALS